MLLTAVLTLLGMIGAMLLLMEAGRRAGARAVAHNPASSEAGVSAVVGAVFALMGLLIAFTFAGASSRFDERRHLIVREANDIGTAWLRLDLLPTSAQPTIRDRFRQYVDTRVAVYQQRDLANAKVLIAKAGQLQDEIWSLSVSACKEGCSPAATTLLLSSQNAMFDITTTRTMAIYMHTPPLIYVMLFLLVLTSALVAGYGMGVNQTRGRFHMLAFVATVTLAVYVIVDFEYPRLGLIRVDSFDQLLIDLQERTRRQP